MRSKICVTLILASTGVTSLTGCCTVLHGDRQGLPKEARRGFDWGCGLIGNLVFGGIVGILVDTGTGTAWIYDDYAGPVSKLERTDDPSEIPDHVEIVYVHVNDGSAYKVRRTANQKIEESQAAIRVGSEEVKYYEWNHSGHGDAGL